MGFRNGALPPKRPAFPALPVAEQLFERGLRLLLRTDKPDNITPKEILNAASRRADDGGATGQQLEDAT